MDKNLLWGFRGRIGRKAFWLAMAMLPIICFVLFSILDPFQLIAIVSGEQNQVHWNPFALGAAGGTAWVAAAINAKRLHDRDLSAWWLLAPGFLLAFCVLLARGEPPRLLLAAGALITVAPIIWLIAEMGFQPGSEGDNRFGPPPANDSFAFKFRKPTGSEIATNAIRGVLWSPLGILIILPVQLIELLLLPFRRRHVLFGIDGRIRRRDFWRLTLMAFVLAIVFDTLPLYAGAYLSGRDYYQLESSPALKPFHLLIIGLAAWSVTAIGGKRLHDRNYSAWWIAVFSPLLAVVLVALLGSNPTVEAVLDVLLLLCLPFALWLIVQLGLLKGTPGPNRFGPDPLEPAPPQ